VEGDGFGVIDVLDTHEGLDERGLCEVEVEVEVEVHDTHHGATHVCRAELLE